MDNTMTDTRDVILALKQVKEEKNLSLDQIKAIMEEKDFYVSKTTLSRVFAKGSEDKSFNYEGTLRPIANALLDIETMEIDDDTDTKAFKAILKLKKDVIVEYTERIKELKEEKEALELEYKAKLAKEKMKYHELLATEAEKFQRSLDFATNQIALKDKRIDQLMDANDRLSITNNRLLNQFLECPLKNNCAE